MPPSSRWRAVDADTAAADPHYGIAGWLLFILVWLSLALGLRTIAEASILLGPEAIDWSAMTWFDFARMGADYSLWLADLAVVILALRLSPRFPAVFIAVLWINAAVTAVDPLYWWATTGDPAADLARGRAEADLGGWAVVGRVAAAVLTALVLTWYLQVSRRVNVTYRRLVSG